MTHLTRLAFCLLLVLFLSPAALAADDTSNGVKALPGLNTNVIGSQEAPTVLNLVPWKDQPINFKAKDATSRLLDQVLQPLDVEVLDREIEYYHLLNKISGKNADLFLHN